MLNFLSGFWSSYACECELENLSKKDSWNETELKYIETNLSSASLEAVEKFYRTASLNKISSLLTCCEKRSDDFIKEEVKDVVLPFSFDSEKRKKYAPDLPEEKFKKYVYFQCKDRASHIPKLDFVNFNIFHLIYLRKRLQEHDDSEPPWSVKITNPKIKEISLDTEHVTLSLRNTTNEPIELSLKLSATSYLGIKGDFKLSGTIKNDIEDQELLLVYDGPDFSTIKLDLNKDLIHQLVIRTTKNCLINLNEYGATYVTLSGCDYIIGDRVKDINADRLPLNGRKNKYNFPEVRMILEGGVLENLKGLNFAFLEFRENVVIKSYEVDELTCKNLCFTCREIPPLKSLSNLKKLCLCECRKPDGDVIRMNEFGQYNMLCLFKNKFTLSIEDITNFNKLILMEQSITWNADAHDRSKLGEVHGKSAFIDVELSSIACLGGLPKLCLHGCRIKNTKNSLYSSNAVCASEFKNIEMSSLSRNDFILLIDEMPVLNNLSLIKQDVSLNERLYYV